MALELKQEAEWVSEEAYLQSELLSEIKHEYIDGEVYAMAGPSKNHQRITGNVSREFGNQLKNTPCEPFSSDIKVKVGTKFFYPDVMVVCKDDSDNDYYTEIPLLLSRFYQNPPEEWMKPLKNSPIKPCLRFKNLY